MRIKQQQHYGFTLIELLVVVSIIALLVSILLPALGNARQQALRAVGASNIRQLNIANTAYALENDDYYVLAAEDMMGRNLKRWHGQRNHVNEAFDPTKSPLVEYLHDGEVKMCPAFKKFYRPSGQQNANFEAGCGGYGYNDQYLGARLDKTAGYTSSARQTDVSDPAMTVMFTDSAFRQSITKTQQVYIEYSFAHPPYWSWYLASLSDGAAPVDSNLSRPAPSIHFRHDGYANVAWVDGHISPETMKLSAPYVTHAIMTKNQTAEMALGWFGPDDNSLFDLE